MPDLSTQYMGIKLRNPLIAGSSGHTSRIDTIRQLADGGVSAIVLKSLFEEDILPTDQNSTEIAHRPVVFPISGQTPASLVNYLSLIRECKNSLDIPVIASINCVSYSEWITFAKRIEDAGADALELNLFVLPSDPMRSSDQNEKVYFDILNELRRQVKFPLAAKIAPFFAGMTKMALKLSWTGISGMVLFNRFYTPDIDAEAMCVIDGPVISNPEEMLLPLRWTAMLSDRVMCDIAGSTGVHDGRGMVRMMLAGAKAVQVVSAFYKHGPGYAKTMLDELEDWMLRHKFETTKDFIGKLSLKRADNPADYERFQYLSSFRKQSG